MSRIPLIFAIILCALFSGCAVTQRAIDTAEVAAVGSERYHVLAQAAFDGTIDPEMGLIPITLEEWTSTPNSVRLIVSKLLGALDTHRFAFYSISFQLDSGPDPQALELKPVITPKVADENDDLLADPPENDE